MRILDDLDDLFDELSQARQSLRGLLHISNSFGFGRYHVAPAISLLAERYHEMEIRLDVFDRVVPSRLEDLPRYGCLVLKERNNVFGVWNLDRGGKQQSVRISGPFSSNNGEIVLQWASMTAASFCAPSGMSNRYWSAARWCRYCLNTVRAPTWGLFTPPG